jgi:hypothetical protein
MDEQQISQNVNFFRTAEDIQLLLYMLKKLRGLDFFGRIFH